MTVIAPPPSGGDDAPMIQALINANFPIGETVALQPGTYLINSEINIGASLAPGKLIGVPHGWYGGSVGSELRAAASMRSVLAVESFRQNFSNLHLNANRLATYGVYLNGAANATFTNCWVHDAVLDGYFSELGTLNQGIRLVRPNVDANGTTYVTAGIATQYTNGHRTTIAGTATLTAGVQTITIAGGTTLTGLGIRRGSMIRVGGTKATAFYGWIQSVTSNVVTLQPAPQGWPTTNLSGLDYAIGVGDGWHEEHSGSNGFCIFEGGAIRSNGNCGIVMNALYGDTANTINVDFNNFAGIAFGSADFGGNVEQCIADHVYMEENTIDYAIASVLDASIREPTANGSIFSVEAIFAAGNEGTITRNGEIENIAFGTRKSFIFQIRNTAGALEGRFVSDLFSGTGLGSVFTQISNPTGTYTALAAINGGVGFGTVGAGIYSTAANLLIFDNPKSQASILDAEAVLESNTTGIGNRISPSITSMNVNGTTTSRFTLRLVDGAGNQQNWNTINIPAGTHLAIRVNARLK